MDGGGRGEQRHERPRHPRGDARPELDDRDRRGADRHGNGRDGAEQRVVGEDAVHEVRRQLLDRESERVADLTRRDDQGDAGREADRHRIRHEPDHVAEPRKRHPHQEHAGDQRRHGEPIHADLYVDVSGVDAVLASVQPTNAPVGPPICTRLPPNAEIRKPPMIAV